MEYQKLRLLPHKSSLEITQKIDKKLQEWNKTKESFIVDSVCPRFQSGEAKGLIKQSVRGSDLYIIADVLNNSITYEMFGQTQRMSPDDIYQDVKRMIAAANGKPENITVIMPFLYEGRQHRRQARESLDCSLMLNELAQTGIKNIITFDAHDSRVQNSIPYHSLENVSPMLQFVEAFLKNCNGLKIDKNNLIIVCPDEGATHRGIQLSQVFSVNMGMFYKQRDFTTVVNGRNPIISHEYIGPKVSKKTAIIIDDMISSGDSMLDVCSQLKYRGAQDIYIFASFGLFTSGMKLFDEAFEKKQFTRIFTTNLIYQNPELLKRPYYTSVNMEDYVAALISTLHKGESISDLITPFNKAKAVVEKYKEEHK